MMRLVAAKNKSNMTTTQMRTFRPRREVQKKWLWTAAVVASSHIVAQAFVIQTHHHHRTIATAPQTALTTRSYPALTTAASPFFPYNTESRRGSLPRQQQHRLFFANRKNESEGEGFLSKIGKAAKSLLPASWFQTEEEKKKALARQRVKEEVSGSLQELFRDAPLPIRMLGNVISPLMSSVMSGLAETVESQRQATEAVLDKAQRCIQNDSGVRTLLSGGDDDIQVGAPISQSSSTTSINGQTSTQVQLILPVTGRYATGMAQVQASNGDIQRIIVQGAGRTVNVSLAGGSGPRRAGSTLKGKTNGDDNIIEAEIIEKETRK